MIVLQRAPKIGRVTPFEEPALEIGAVQVLLLGRELAERTNMTRRGTEDFTPHPFR